MVNVGVVGGGNVATVQLPLRLYVGVIRRVGIGVRWLLGARAEVGLVVDSGVGGTTGASGILGGAAGVAVGVTCSLLVFCGRWVSWLVGFSTGVTLGTMLMTTIGSERNLVGIVVTALLAAGLGKLFQRVADAYRRWSSPLIRAYSTRIEAQWKTRRSVTRTSAD